MLKIENVVTPSDEQWKAIIFGARNPMNSWDKSDSFCIDGGMFDGCQECSDRMRCAYRYGEGSRYRSDGYIGPNDLDLMTRLRNAGTDHRKYMRSIIVYLDIIAPLYWWKEFKTYRAGRKFIDDEPDIIDDGYLEYDIEMNSCSTMHKIHAKEFTLDDFSHEHLDDEENCCEVNGGDHFYPLTSMELLELKVRALNYWRNKYLEAKTKPMKEEAKRAEVMKKYWWQMIQLLPSSYNQKRTVMLNYEVLANMYKSRRNHKLDEWHTFCDWIESLPYSELITGKVKENDCHRV